MGNDIEIRKYKASVAIEATSGPMNGKGNSNAFRKLAGYIGVMSKPQNERQESIAMTSPVVNYEDESGTGKQ